MCDLFCHAADNSNFSSCVLKFISLCISELYCSLTLLLIMQICEYTHVILTVPWSSEEGGSDSIWAGRGVKSRLITSCHISLAGGTAL